MDIFKFVIRLGITVVFLTACSAVKVRNLGPFVPGPDTVLIQGVPFYPQEDYQCGPASLAGVLNYWKVAATPSSIAQEIFSPSAKGTLTIDMLLYAEKMGLKASQYSGGMDDLKSRVREGYPLVVLVDYGFWVYQVDHFMVVIGYNDDGVIVNSGGSEKLFVSNKDFLNTWQRTKFWTLRIKPK